jgi:ketopantoate reductase
MIPEKLIGVAGAGSIGCFVGGVLAAAGRPVRCWRARASFRRSRTMACG